MSDQQGKKPHRIKVWVEAMGETTYETIELPYTKEEWLALSKEEQNGLVEDWAYNEVQMGYGFEEVE